jgi:hypothetical protein
MQIAVVEQAVYETLFARVKWRNKPKHIDLQHVVRQLMLALLHVKSDIIVDSIERYKSYKLQDAILVYFLTLLNVKVSNPKRQFRQTIQTLYHLYDNIFSDIDNFAKLQSYVSEDVLANIIKNMERKLVTSDATGSDTITSDEADPKKAMMIDFDGEEVDERNILAQRISAFTRYHGLRKQPDPVKYRRELAAKGMDNIEQYNKIIGALEIKFYGRIMNIEWEDESARSELVKLVKSRK